MSKHVVVVGGGASGVLLSVHVLRRKTPGGAVTIVERRNDLGAGAAYATDHPDHLLNVRAGNMSAFPDDPGHFAAWLRTSAGAGARVCAELDSFAPRGLYRDYLSGLLAPHLDAGRLRCVHEDAVSVRERHDGVEVRLAGGGGVAGDLAVIATGNEGPSFPPAAWRVDGWGAPAAGTIGRDAPVVVVGTGLTMVDRVVALLDDGHRGPVTAVSRHGLMPQSHRAAPPAPLDGGEVPFGASLSRLTAWLRQRARRIEAGGGDWRTMVDALRPFTQSLWAHLPADERRRFLRHARPFWDCHRHRVAPVAGERLAAARARGQLRIVAAHVTGFDDRAGDGVDVNIVHRGTGKRDVIHARTVFECRGRSADVTGTENPILQQMFHDGLARPDPLRLGLDVTDACALIGADGTPSRRLHALGPITAGVFWEIVAIPDIRQQAARLAGLIESRTGAAVPGV